MRAAVTRRLRAVATIAVLAFAAVLAGSGCHSGSAASGLSRTPAGVVRAGPWRIALRHAPSVPFTGPAASYKIQAQYPVVISGIADPAIRKLVNAAMQQPVTGWASVVARDVISQGNLGTGPSVPAGATIAGADEHTTIVAAGRLVTIRYIFDAGENYGGDAGALLVLRTGTGLALPTSRIMTAQAVSQRGAALIAAAINRHAPQAPPCPGVTGQDIAPYLFAAGPTSLARMQLGVQVGVTRTGIEFFVDPGSQECYRQDVVVPFRELPGLVRPPIVALAQK